MVEYKAAAEDGRLPPVISTQADEDPWDWVQTEEVGEDVDLSGQRVTAVLVSHDAATWLPRTLESLAGLTVAPARLIAIDNASADDSPELLTDAASDGLVDAVYLGRRDFGFGAAVAAALQQDQSGPDQAAPGQSAPDQSGGDTEWLWLLHDDIVASPDVLEQLLTAVSNDDSIDVTGPKLLLPKPRQAARQTRQALQQISEVGVSISGTGRRELGLEPGEIDQGQRDKATPTLGVSTCGMLVRRRVWDELGGLAPEIPVFRDGVEFGWRANLAAKSVVTTPQAELVHLQAGRAGLRPASGTTERPARIDRELGMAVVAAHSRGVGRPLVWLRLVWGCLLRAVGYLFGKAPGRAADELLALSGFVRHPARVRDIRTRHAQLKTTRQTVRFVNALRPRRWSSLRIGAETVSAAVAERYRTMTGPPESAASLDELTSDDFAATPAERPARVSPMLVSLVLVIIGSVIAGRSLIGAGFLTAPGLLPSPDRWTGLLERWLAPIAGAPDASAGPWLGWLFLASGVLLGRPDWLITLLICGIVPLSLLSAYPVCRHLVSHRRVRLLAAVGYALLPVMLGGVNQGRLTLSVFAWALPLLVLSARSLVLRRPGGPEAGRGGWGAGLALLVLVAFAPSFAVVALIAAVIAALTVARDRRKIGRLAIALAVPLVILAPWWPSIVAGSGRFLTGTDPASQGADAAPAVWQLLLGRGTGDGWPPLWLGAVVFGSIWLIAVTGLLLRSTSRVVLAGWSTAVIGFAMAAGLSRLVVEVPPLGDAVRPAVGCYLLLAFGALVLTGAVGIDRLGDQLTGRSFGILQLLTVLGAVIAIGAVVLAGGWWFTGGAAGPIHRDRMDAIPPYISNAMQGDTAVRTLAIDLRSDQPQAGPGGGPVRYFVSEDDQARLGDAERGYAFGGNEQAPMLARGLVQRLVAGTADEQIGPELSQLGIQYLWVRGASNAERTLIDNTPGLGTASGNADFTAWQLESTAARNVVIPATGDAGDQAGGTGALAVPGRTSGRVSIPAAGQARILRLGAAADPRWHAQLDGHELQPVPAEHGLQGFAVPQSGGQLTYQLTSPGRGWIAIAQLVLLALVAVLAAPSVRRLDARDPAQSARRAAGLGPQKSAGLRLAGRDK